MNKAEWMGVIALFLNLATIAFSAGVLYSTQQDHNRRIALQEAKTEELGPRVERIDANVAFLTELAREDRSMRRDAK